MSILVLLVTCGVTGLAISVLRRWPRLVFLATMLGSAALILTLTFAPSSPINLNGRTLSLDLTTRIFIWPAVGMAAALAFFGPLTFERAGDTPATILSNSQGAYFFWSLAPLIVAVSIDNFPLAAFSWAVGLIVLTLLAQPRYEGRTGGAAHFLLLTVVGTASLLLSNRFFDLYPLTPENLDLVRDAFLLIVWGLGLLLAVAPLHIWLGPLADEMPLLGVAFLVGVAQPVGLGMLFQLMSRTLWLTDKSPLLDVMLLGGIITVPVGAVLALPERREGRFLAYLSLVSLGHALIGFGLGTAVGLAGAMLVMLNRAIGTVLMAGGMIFVRYHQEHRWQIVGALTMLGGGITTLGLGPLLGFAARWGLYASLAPIHPLLLILLFASTGAAMLVVVRAVADVFARLGEKVASTGEVKIVPYLCTGVVIALLLFVLVAGLFPQWFADPLIATLGRAGYLR